MKGVSVFCVPGVLFLTAATVLSVLTTISLPFLHPFDIVRVDFSNGLGSISNAPNAANSFRFGIWGFCYETATTGGFDCQHPGHGYSVEFTNASGGAETIAASWTRGLAVHAVACVVTGIAWLLSFGDVFAVTLVASIVSALAAFLTFLAFIIDIALFAWTSHQMTQLRISESTKPGVAFWLTLATFILLLLGGCTVCFGHRRHRQARGETYPMDATSTGPWYRRGLRRNNAAAAPVYP